MKPHTSPPSYRANTTPISSLEYCTALNCSHAILIIRRRLPATQRNPSTCHVDVPLEGVCTVLPLIFCPLRFFHRNPAQHKLMAPTAAEAADTASVNIKIDRGHRPQHLFAFRIFSILSMRRGVMALLALTVYLAVSCSVMSALEPSWTPIDSAYFAMATMSTVGYGDRNLTWTERGILASVASWISC